MTTDTLIDLAAEVRDYVRGKVAAGFATPAEVADAAVEVFCDDADETTLVPLAVRLTTEAVAAQLREQSAWPPVTDCDRLDAAFAELNQVGIVARHDFSCCGTCGVCEIGDEMQQATDAGVEVLGYTFYHMQDTESAVAGGGLYLNYGAAEPGDAAALGVARRIVEELGWAGLVASWDGRLSTRIRVELDWKRRAV